MKLTIMIATATKKEIIKFYAFIYQKYLQDILAKPCLLATYFLIIILLR